MRPVLFCFLLLNFGACAPLRLGDRFFKKQLRKEIETSPVFSRAFTGFHLLDAQTGRSLCAVNSDRNFTPASNVKILTLATCLGVLGDSLPGLKYCTYPDSSDPSVTVVRFRGTGDPTFLHPRFQAWQPVFQLFINAGKIAPEPDRMQDTPLAPGWAWEDMQEAFSTERSALPIYGNAAYLTRTGGRWRGAPAYFRIPDTLTDNYAAWVAAVRPGELPTIPPPANGECELPIRQVAEKTIPLLLDTLARAGAPKILTATPAPAGTPWRTLYSVPADTVYRAMMHHSDNFLAEQLLLLSAGARFDTLRQDKIMAWCRDSLFPPGLPASRWVDGSGLSRYNLASPRLLTGILLHLYRTQPRARLFSLFPAGGVSGTLSDWYAGPGGQPFVFAKTGTVGGVHCLSGYLVGKSGRVLAFSFMHNHYIGSSRPWKEEMQRLLLEIRART